MEPRRVTPKVHDPVRALEVVEAIILAKTQR
jgi:hypothetical protein